MVPRLLGTALVVVISVGLVGCCGAKAAPKAEKGEPAAATPGPAATTAAADPTAAPSVAASLPSCSKTALLDMATPRRPPVPTPVLGVRLPAGAKLKAKSPQLSSIEYYAPGTPPIEVACTVREQLEADKWTVQSMTGSSPVTMIVRKGKSAVQIMVGPSNTEGVAVAIVTPLK